MNTMFLTEVEETSTNLSTFFTEKTQALADWLGISHNLGYAIMGVLAVGLLLGVAVLVRKYVKKAKRGYYR